MATVITPGYIREQLGDEEFNALIDYLMGLEPAGGCDAAASGATPAASPASSPAALPEGTPAPGT
jgi:hypothetical protein